MTLISIPKYDPIVNVDIYMNGSTSYVILNPVQNLPADEFTLEFWVRALSVKPDGTSNTGATLLSYTLQAGIQNLSLQGAGNLNIYINNIQSQQTGVSLIDDTGQWHFFSMTWNTSGVLKLFKDGSMVYTGSVATGSKLLSGGSLVLGQMQTQVGSGFVPAQAFAGEIADFRIWNKARAPFFIAQTMNRTLNGNENQLTWQGVEGTTSAGTPAPAAWLSVAAVSESLIYALDSQGSIWVSTDFGVTWIQPNTTQKLVQLSATSTIAVGVDSSNRIWFSADQGKNWTQPNPGSFLVQVSAAGGIVMGIDPTQTVWVTSNGGLTWTSQTNTRLAQAFLDPAGNAWGINKSGNMFQSANQGVTWTPVNTGPLLWKSVAAQAGILLALATDNTLYTSADGGATWTPVLSAYVLSFVQAMLLENVIWAIDSGGNLLIAELNTRLVLSWQFNEGYGNAAFDASGNQNNGLLGDGQDDMPDWVISSMLQRPHFINDTALAAVQGIVSVSDQVMNNVPPVSLLVDTETVSIPEPVPPPEPLKTKKNKAEKPSKNKK